MKIKPNLSYQSYHGFMSIKQHELAARVSYIKRWKRLWH